MPKVPKRYLILISGLLWSAVGIFLLKLGIGWIIHLSAQTITIVLIAGLSLSAVKIKFLFSKLANKNIQRINAYQKERVCVWAFQKWSSYLIIVFMMSMGIYMRHTSSIPKYIISPLYIGIGLALLVSSFLYYKFLLSLHRK